MEKKKLFPAVSYFNSALNERIGTKGSRSLRIAGASCIGNTFIGIGKLVMGIVSMSFFTCVSAFYTFGMVFAKSCALTGIMRAKNKKDQYRYYVLSGMILITVSVLYIVYSARLFFYPVLSSYHMYVGIGIAAFTFTELALNIRGVIIERQNRTPLIHAIKMINLASSLICLVLTQTALLSFADLQNLEMHSQANGLMGVIMGSIATILGVVMIIRIKQIQKGKNYGTAYRKVKRLMKKQCLTLHFKPIYYTESEDDNQTLYVRFLEKPSKERIDELQFAIKGQLEFNLLDVDSVQLEKV